MINHNNHDTLNNNNSNSNNSHESHVLKNLEQCFPPFLFDQLITPNHNHDVDMMNIHHRLCVMCDIDDANDDSDPSKLDSSPFLSYYYHHLLKHNNNSDAVDLTSNDDVQQQQLIHLMIQLLNNSRPTKNDENDMMNQQQQQQEQQHEQQHEQQPYIPKYNTFIVNPNENLHMESMDDYFQRANLSVNIMRSRGMMREFHLDLHKDIQPLFSLLSSTTHNDGGDGDESLSLHDVVEQQNVIQLNQKLQNMYSGGGGGDGGGDGDGGDRSSQLSDKWWGNETCFTNYRLIDQWNQDQQLDMYNELMGEKEAIVLTHQSVLQQVLYNLNSDKSSNSSNKNKNNKNNIQIDYPSARNNHNSMLNCSSQFKSLYFHYLRCIDYYLLCCRVKKKKKKHKDEKTSMSHYDQEQENNNLPSSSSSLSDMVHFINKRARKKRRSKNVYPRDLYFGPISVPISIECIGYLSRTYFIPWMNYTEESIRGVIVPWFIFKYGVSIKVLQCLSSKHHNMYSLYNRIMGLRVLQYHRELTDLNTELLLRNERDGTLCGTRLQAIVRLQHVQQKVNSFYLNERVRYSINYRADVEKLKSLIRDYLHREHIRLRVNQYCLLNQRVK